MQVGRDRSILLLQVGEDNYLVGVSQAGIQLLSKVEGEFETEQPLGMPVSMQRPFREFFEKQLGRSEKNGRENDE